MKAKYVFGVNVFGCDIIKYNYVYSDQLLFYYCFGYYLRAAVVYMNF